MKLDVGCGAAPKGDVNCDLFITDVCDHRAGASFSLQIKSIPNFVLCSAEYLPFKNDCFDEVFSAQVIEHLKNPFAFMRELKRICKSHGLITIETVHRYGEAIRGMISKRNREWHKVHHISKFNTKWFNAAASALKLSERSSYVLSYSYFPNTYMRIFQFPFEIGFTFEKQ
jgi:ubiquinone/menaquinone biosynthesis C-methylase UbiE